LHWAVARTHAALVVVVALAVAATALSGGSEGDPRTPAALPGLPSPFLGTAVVGSGGLTAAIDAYGNVVDLRAPGPAGPGLIENPVERQKAGTAPADTGIVARVPLGDGRTAPLWRADTVRQRYLPRTNVLRTVAHFGDTSVVVVRGIGGPAAARADRRWIGHALPLGKAAPNWARRLYPRSLLVLRALIDRRTGAVAAGIREGWTYVWPRDASVVAIALASTGYRAEARRIVRFLLEVDLSTAARFHGDGAPVPGRGPQGDVAGWIAAAARAAGMQASRAPYGWRDRADYQEGDDGDYLANAIASGVGAARIRRLFATRAGLGRRPGDPGSEMDSAVAWAVRPFPQPALFPLVRLSLRRLLAREGRFGIVPSEEWGGGEDPWTAPTAWTAWGLAALGERREALRLLGDLRRAATPLGMLPERVDARTGAPRSTTPLAWSHAFTILALRELWPGRAGS
jgi:glucoamylase